MLKEKSLMMHETDHRSSSDEDLPESSSTPRKKIIRFERKPAGLVEIRGNLVQGVF